MKRLAVVTAGLSRPSSTRLLAEQLAEATRRRLAEAGEGVEVEVFDLRDVAHDVVNAMLTGFPPQALKAITERVEGADALIAVTPVFSASYSGLFKSFFDVLDPQALAGHPVLIGATGGSQRHSLALEHAVRPLFAYLHALVVPTAVYAASSDWGSGAASSTTGPEGADRALTERIRRAGAELADLVLRSAPRPVADPFADVTPFARLLAAEQ